MYLRAICLCLLGKMKAISTALKIKRHCLLTGLFYICEYFHISPQEFFDTEIRSPEKVEQLIECAKSLTDEQLDSIINLIKSIK